jgi:hypothetical protein
MLNMNLPSISRREFAARLSLGAAAIPLAAVPAAALASQAQAPKSSETPINAQPDPTEPKPPTQSELLLDVVRLRYADERLTDEVLEHIRGEIEADLFRSAVLHGYPLKNSDAPAFVFAAYRGD